MPKASRSLTVGLGDLRQRVDERVKSGAYANADEVLRAAVRALDRQDTAIKAWMRDRIEESLSDPRPDIPAAKVFARLRQHHRRQAPVKPGG